jgi:hypothetical protein
LEFLVLDFVEQLAVEGQELAFGNLLVLVVAFFRYDTEEFVLNKGEN